jgi:hypothetical protein
VAKAYDIAGRKGDPSLAWWPYVRAILDSCIAAGRWVEKQKPQSTSKQRPAYQQQPAHISTAPADFTPDKAAALAKLNALYNSKSLPSADM